MDANILKLINEKAIEIFSNITLIDITHDKVTFLTCQNPLQVLETSSYEEYYEKLKKVIHPDYVSKYFEAISLNKLQSSNNEYEWIKYSKLSSNLSYDSYLDIIKKIDEDKILLLGLKCRLDNEFVNTEDDLSYLVADVIVGIESIINTIKSDSYEVNNAINYINELLGDLKNKNKKVLQNYAEKITIEVNKTHESLLIVDDDNLTRNIFKKVFENNYNIIEAKNGAEAVEIIEKNIVVNNGETTENIVGIFLDLKMPIMDGFGVLNYLNDKRLISRMPVIIISADDAKETKEEVYKYEIADMLEKPFNYDLIKKRVNNMVRMYAKSNILNNLVGTGKTKLKGVVSAFVDAYLVDYGKTYELSKELLTKLLTKYSEINEIQLDINTIVEATKYYNVAINAVPRRYLENVQGLSSEERKIVVNYPVISEEIINIVAENQSDIFVKHAREIALMHNERYDGLGFPNALKTTAIPGYIYLVNLAIEYANCLLAKKSKEEIISIISSKSGNKYSPKAVELFLTVLKEGM